MKLSKDKIKRIALVVLMIALAVLEFGLDMRRLGGRSGSIFTILILLSIVGLFQDIRRATKPARRDKEEPHPSDPSDMIAHATMNTTGTALGGLDWLLHKINPGYDPDAERNARNADPYALRKLDDMKAAGLIDEKEYQARKEKMAGK